LEGTVDVENGMEVRPHHYIRSVLPEGPVGKNGSLRSGDELLEVNGHRLLGRNHMEVVAILKELPINIRMICARCTNEQQLPHHYLTDITEDRAAFAAKVRTSHLQLTEIFYYIISIYFAECIGR